MNELVETRDDLLRDLRLPTAGENGRSSYPVLDSLVESGSRYVKDTRINLKNTLKSDHLSEKECALLAYAIAVNNANDRLRTAAAARARDAGATDEEIAEMAACASLLSANNVLYRFRHFMENSGGTTTYSERQARIKMSIMARPVTGKLFFELASLAVSAVNGCEACVTSHEKSVRAAGATEEQIFDAVRLAAVVTAAGKLL